MVVEFGGNSYDVSQLCASLIGIVLLAFYAGFVWVVTHTGDFYQIRRWKGAICIGVVPGVVLLALLSLFVSSAIMSRKMIDLLQIVEFAGGLLGISMTIIIPVIIVATIGTHYRLRQWLDSDDLLERIWKDPNKSRRSPIQEL